MPELMDILAKVELKTTANTVVTVPSDSWVKLPFDTEGFSRGTALTADTANNEIVINEAGPYSFVVMANAQFDRSEEIQLTVAKNGTPEASYLSEQGRGLSKPVDFSWMGISHFEAGDKLSIVLKMESTETDVEILNANLVVAKEF